MCIVGILCLVADASPHPFQVKELSGAIAQLARLGATSPLPPQQCDMLGQMGAALYQELLFLADSINAPTYQISSAFTQAAIAATALRDQTRAATPLPLSASSSSSSVTSAPPVPVPPPERPRIAPSAVVPRMQPSVIAPWQADGVRSQYAPARRLCICLRCCLRSIHRRPRSTLRRARPIHTWLPVGMVDEGAPKKKRVRQNCAHNKKGCVASHLLLCCAHTGGSACAECAAEKKSAPKPAV